MKVKVVTDSTADLPPALAADLDITVVPARIQFGADVYRDGVDLSTDEFYRKLQASPVLPKTSPPSIGAFRDAYRRLAQEAESIVSIHISADLSATYDAARLASMDMGCQISLIDSQTTSMACGILAIVAAKAARDGASLAEIEDMLRGAVPHTITYGVFGTLEYLAKGGRIGKAQAFLGSVLKINPILAVQGGKVLPVERVRTRAKAIERLCEIVRDFGVPREMSVMSTTNPEEAEDLAQRLSPIFPPERMYRASIGPAMGTQVGPDAVGVAIAREA
jgi:DegV family protein with EDD domain